MAEFMNQDHLSVARFLSDCFLMREVGPWYLTVQSESFSTTTDASTSDSFQSELLPVLDDEFLLL